MPFKFENLDGITRNLMKNEVQLDVSRGLLYFSQRFNQYGKQNYPNLLLTAIEAGTEHTLAEALRIGCFEAMETRRTPKGEVSLAKVPENAPEILAEGEFNRFYIRALCLRLINGETGRLEIYRAKEVSHPRSDSQQMIGKIVDPRILLNDLRENLGTDTALGLPAGPNSGLSVRIKK